MPTIELQIIQSTQDPTLVTFRPLNRAASSVRRELTVAGFRPGERVYVVSKEEFDSLKRRGDETVELRTRKDDLT
jgi:hypothetical protein